MRCFALALALSVAVASAKQIVITVGGNTTNNASTVFQPAEVSANIGDVVFFNFTQGNHSAIQSTFASPCIPAHDTNATINGFDSGPRDTVNGTAITNLPVTVSSNDTIWFYDAATCAAGGVGGINVNESSTETLDGFRRNAIRLNGTATSNGTSNSNSTSASAPLSATAPSRTGSGTAPARTSNAAAAAAAAAMSPERAVVRGLGTVLPFALFAVML
ncbi:hypothetical protein C8Q78DRAFT_188429 [Trametes maxima]|nr:hypothetical protein C8Q78DRAFT_188429 [Trametes maxima]